MSDLKQEFEKVAKQVQELKTKPNDKELLDIYGLYKQATVGDCDQPKPGMFNMKEKFKHESWTSRKGMTQDQAMKAYIETVKKLIAQYSP